jgi:hypothetical protein
VANLSGTKCSHLIRFAPAQIAEFGEKIVAAIPTFKLNAVFTNLGF